VFALPFALIGFFIGVKDLQKPFNFLLFIYVLLCMVFARNAAMGFNRYIDRKFDEKNPRTLDREIPKKIINPQNALIFVIVNALLFILTTYFINDICFYLSPIALIVILGYSFTKRFTFICHLILGLGLSLAPIGAYLAVTGVFAWTPLFFSIIVLFWVSGFDIIYSLQDKEIDSSMHLKSIPVFLGIRNAIIFSIILHIVCLIFIVYAGFVYPFGMIYWIGSTIFICLLFYQHLLVKPNDLSKVNMAFATLNGIGSVIFSVFVLLDLFSQPIFEFFSF
jgi:4-hydroxybenzoate polyprenyltransferase